VSAAPPHRLASFCLYQSCLSSWEAFRHGEQFRCGHTSSPAPNLRPALGAFAIPPPAVPIAWTAPASGATDQWGGSRRSPVPEGDGQTWSGAPSSPRGGSSPGGSTRPQDLSRLTFSLTPVKDWLTTSPAQVLPPPPLSSPDLRPLGHPAPNHPTVPGRDKSLISHPTLT